MSKKRRTFSIDEDIHHQFKEDDATNASAVVNNLLREYLAAGKAPEAAMQMRLNEIEAELQRKREERARIDSRIERLERQREDVADKMRERERNTHDAVLKIADRIEAGRFPREELVRENEAVQVQAENAGMSVERFIDRVEAELE